MKYVFIDTEGGVNQECGLKTCGIVVVDEDFNVLEEREVYIEMNRNGSKRKIGDDKYSRPFNQMYCVLRDYLTAEDSYVLGFDVLNDVKRINEACDAYKTHWLTFNFFDVQLLYRQLYGAIHNLSTCVQFLGITEQFEYHKSKEDARATARVMQELCKRENMTIAQFIEKYPKFSGHAERYMAQYTVEEWVHTVNDSSVRQFKIRVDFPLLCFKKNVGGIIGKKDDGREIRDGSCIFYDNALDRLFRDRHPNKAGKADPDSPIFADFIKIRNRGLYKLSQHEPEFYNAPQPLSIRRFIVSYECTGSIEGDTLNLLHGNEYLKQHSEENAYVARLFRYNRNPEELIKKYYDAESFVQTLLKNTKWNYGDRNKELVLEPFRVEEIQLQNEDTFFVPRVYYGMLTGKLSTNEVVACKNEHMGLASAQKVKDIDSLNLPEKSLRLIVKDAEGNVYGYIPIVRKIKFPMFDCTYELPFLIRRQLPNDFFNN